VWNQLGNINFLYREGNEIHELSIGVFLHKRIMSTVKRVELVNDRMPFILLKGHSCDIIVLRVRVPSGDKNDDVKDSFYLGFTSRLFRK
jgi:hypothetical protein